jgi:hypothetical protein
MTQCLVAGSPFLKANAGGGTFLDPSCSVSERFKSVGKGKKGDKTWNVTHTVVIIGSTDRWCGQNQIHLENVG